MTTATLSLTDFLLARIAEDEAAEEDGCVVDATGARFAASEASLTRVLAECEAKRRIVELRYSWNLQAERSPEPPFGHILQTQVVTADTVLRTLAAVYADHEDYRSEWSA